MSTCKYCGKEIVWAKTLSGAKVPFDFSGGNHWRTCTEAQRIKEEERAEAARIRAEEADKHQLRLFDEATI